MLMHHVSKHALVLGFAALLCVGLTAAVNELTKPEITKQALQAKLSLMKEVLPSADESLLEQCLLLHAPESFGVEQTPVYRYQTRNTDGVLQTQAVVVETTAQDGYSGDIKLLAAIEPHTGKVLAVRTLSHKETPGLGDKIELRKADWIHSLANQQVQNAEDKRWAVKKDGGQFDQFAGATITPRAVVGAVKRSALYFLTTKNWEQNAATCAEVAHD